MRARHGRIHDHLRGRPFRQNTVGSDGISDLVQSGRKIAKVGKKIRVDGKMFFFIKHFHFERLTKIHGGGFFDIKNGGIWDGDLECKVN
jgi:hypothetical protein